MRNIAFTGSILLVVLAAVPPVRAEFAIGDQDRVVFFGNRVFQTPAMAMGVETYVRIRYPESKARFRSYGRQAAAVLRGAVKRFEKQVVPFDPTVVVLSFVTGDLPQREFSEGQLTRFEEDFAKMVDRAKQSGARVYVMTPLCPEVSQKPQLEKVEYAATVGKYAAAIRTIAQEKGATVIDWFALSEQYSAEHAGSKRLAITADGTHPSALGFALGATAILDAWGADPCNITLTADWTSESASVSMGQVSVTQVGEDKMLLKLSGMPIPWVFPGRGTITGEDWPGTKYYSFTLHIPNVPDGGIMISEPNGKNALPYLSEQLRQGTDLGFVGPLVRLDAVAGLAKWMQAKYKAVRDRQRFMQKPIPEPEYQQAYETYYLGLAQYIEATENVVLRLPRILDNLTLELYKALLPPKESKDQGKARVGPEPAKNGDPKQPGQGKKPDKGKKPPKHKKRGSPDAKP